jgi:hypothetical protein
MRLDGMGSYLLYLKAWIVEFGEMGESDDFPE